ncbi:hypothetical protein [Paractinoplanes durhamensis]|uniref:EF-hand domain-containing protein n=1 Tax=Paractinoplanes durhamensis TaxID=113563 RepID=A0ABQ3YNR8_9ACTN|nr:hypothetical protein [Actinoplanes durhamensis]GID99224.1 hypothetical protein Adu01nite_05750 [Actinoplanes durhamensis]
MTQQDADGDDLGMWSEFGTAAAMAAAQVPEGRAGAGDHPDHPDLDGLPAVQGLGDAPSIGLDEAVRHATAAVTQAAAPKGYHNRVDADGDGHLDAATYRGDGHGGAEILVDLDGDGKVDFIGHDTDLDNRVDFADYDKDHDGVFEKRMIDDNHDGYLDRAEFGHGS